MEDEDWIPVHVAKKDRSGKIFHTDAMYDRIGVKFDRDIGGIITDIWEDGLFGRSLMVPQPAKVPEGLK